MALNMLHKGQPEVWNGILWGRTAEFSVVIHCCKLDIRTYDMSPPSLTLDDTLDFRACLNAEFCLLRLEEEEAEQCLNRWRTRHETAKNNLKLFREMFEFCSL